MKIEHALIRVDQRMNKLDFCSHFADRSNERRFVSLMPSKISSLLNSRTNSSSSFSSDEENGKALLKYRRNEKLFLERPRQFDENQSESDVSENDEEKFHFDRSTSSKQNPAYFLTRQKTLYENDWPKKSSAPEKNPFQSVSSNQISIVRRLTIV